MTYTQIGILNMVPVDAEAPTNTFLGAHQIMLESAWGQKGFCLAMEIWLTGQIEIALFRWHLPPGLVLFCLFFQCIF